MRCCIQCKSVLQSTDICGSHPLKLYGLCPVVLTAEGVGTEAPTSRHCCMRCSHNT